MFIQTKNDTITKYDNFKPMFCFSFFCWNVNDEHPKKDLTLKGDIILKFVKQILYSLAMYNNHK
jgi:hypothetical protein